MCSPTPDCEDIDTLHKTLFHWLVSYCIYIYIYIATLLHEVDLCNATTL